MISRSPMDPSLPMMFLSRGCKMLPTEKGKLQLLRIALSLLAQFQRASQWRPRLQRLALFKSIYYKLESERESG